MDILHKSTCCHTDTKYATAGGGKFDKNTLFGCNWKLQAKAGGLRLRYNSGLSGGRTLARP